MFAINSLIARRNTLSKWATEQSFKRNSSYFQEIIETVEFFRNQAQFVQPCTIQLLRDLESGTVLYDHDDSLPHIFTCIDNDDRVILRDSGRMLLFAIDCDLNQFMDEIEQCHSLPLPLAQTVCRDRLERVPDGRFVQSKLPLELHLERLDTVSPTGS